MYFYFCLIKIPNSSVNSMEREFNLLINFKNKFDTYIFVNTNIVNNF